MRIIELFILAVGLSMDAFAVAICKGLSMKKITAARTVVVGLWFGSFQAIMPLIGYAVGYRFKESITAYDHWIAFALLCFIGGKMIQEAFNKKDSNGGGTDESLAPKKMFIMAVATSMDALAIGVTFAFLSVNIVPAISSIGVTTFALSAAGVKIGSVFGIKYKSKAEFIGGVILILLGIKILLEHLFF